MRGEEESEDSGDEKEKLARGQAEEDEEDVRDDAAEFGLSAPIKRTKIPVLDDEDEFELDDELIASESEEGSETYDSAEDSDDSDNEESGPNGRQAPDEEDEEDEFVRGILDPKSSKDKKETKAGKPSSSLAITYPCPATHKAAQQ